MLYISLYFTRYHFFPSRKNNRSCLCLLLSYLRDSVQPKYSPSGTHGGRNMPTMKEVRVSEETRATPTDQTNLACFRAAIWPVLHKSIQLCAIGLTKKCIISMNSTQKCQVNLQNLPSLNGKCWMGYSRDNLHPQIVLSKLHLNFCSKLLFLHNASSGKDGDPVLHVENRISLPY